MNNYEIERRIAKLLINEPFFAYISRYIEKKATEEIPTMSVTINERGRYELRYNPDFADSLPEKYLFGWLKHEFYHIIFNHLQNGEKRKDKERWNIATDLAINSYLVNELPETCLFPEQGEFKELPKFKSSLWYEQNLTSAQVENVKFEFEHDWGGELNTDETAKFEIASSIMKNIIGKAAQQNNWGSVPKNLKEQILISLRNEVDWKSVLRYFVQNTLRGAKISSRKKYNKRFGYAHPGSKIERNAKILIAIDMSGSVGNDLLSKFFAELNNLSDLISFYVAPFDTEIDEEEVYLWKKNTKKDAERTRSGGTCFQAPTDYANENKFNGLIILTDLLAPVPGPCKCKRLWLTNNANKDNFETNETILIVK